jgi:hypothetical protein
MGLSLMNILHKLYFRPQCNLFFSPCIVDGRLVCEEYINVTGCLNTILWLWLAVRQGDISHIQHVIENSSFCTTHKSSVSTGFAEQIMPVLHILCYNSSLVIWTVISLTTAKFMPLIFSMSHTKSCWDLAM